MPVTRRSLAVDRHFRLSFLSIRKSVESAVADLTMWLANHFVVPLLSPPSHSTAPSTPYTHRPPTPPPASKRHTHTWVASRFLSCRSGIAWRSVSNSRRVNSRVRICCQQTAAEGQRLAMKVILASKGRPPSSRHQRRQKQQVTKNPQQRTTSTSNTTPTDSRTTLCNKEQPTPANINPQQRTLAERTRSRSRSARVDRRRRVRVTI